MTYENSSYIIIKKIYIGGTRMLKNYKENINTSTDKFPAGAISSTCCDKDKTERGVTQSSPSTTNPKKNTLNQTEDKKRFNWLAYLGCILAIIFVVLRFFLPHILLLFLSFNHLMLDLTILLWIVSNYELFSWILCICSASNIVACIIGGSHAKNNLGETLALIGFILSFELIFFTLIIPL